MGDQFPFFLLSNASMNVFPDNTPSNFQTLLDNPIQLDGEWEVGVQKISYDSAIANIDTEENITFTFRTYDETSMNDNFTFSYNLTKDGKWRYDWIPLQVESYGDSDLPQVRKTLNAGNTTILKLDQLKVYEFSLQLHAKQFFYYFRSFSSGFAMRLDDNLATYLGFGENPHLFSSREAMYPKDKPKSVTKPQFKIKIFDSNVVECEERIILKKSGEDILSLENVVSRWNETVGKKCGETASIEEGRFIILKKNDKLTLFFSPSLRFAIKHHTPLIGSGRFKSDAPFHLSNMMKVEDEWIVEIYGDRIKTHRKYQEYDTIITIPPRQFATVDALIRRVNPHIKSILETGLGNKYDVKQHHVIFSIENQRTVLKLGSEIQCHLTENFMKLFGFSHQTLTAAHTVSYETPMTLDKREQHLYIQCDLIEPVLVGVRKEFVLRDFIHDKDSSYGIIDIEFEHILFHRIAKQTIPTIKLQITNGLYENIHLRDTKTLVTLMFRKAK